MAQTFSESDEKARPVAIVSKGFADRYWPAGEALGERVAITDGTWRGIVGIVQVSDGTTASKRR